MSFNNMLGIQIPLWMQMHLQTALNLYAIRTVPVPYHINSEISESQDNSNTQHSYTWLHPKHELIALSYSTYIPLDKVQIQKCFKFGTFYFCQQTFLTQHSAGHTCESAIFFNLDIDTSKSLCTFTYYADLKPEPIVLDTGKELLLCNLPTPWSFYCTHEYQIPNNIQGTSCTLIKKSDLCLCSITAGFLYLHENVASCIDRDDMNTQMQLKYTINKAVYIYFPELVPELDLNQDIILTKPRKSNLADPLIVSAIDNDVIRYHAGPIELPTAIQSFKSHQALYKTVGDKALSIDDVDKWITWGNKPMAFVFMCSILTIICLATILILWILVYKLKLKIFKTIKNKIEAHTPRLPRIISDTFSRFKGSVRSKPKSRASRAQHPRAIKMKTMAHHPISTRFPSKVSVQDAINKIETIEADERLMGMDKLTYETPTAPELPGSSTTSLANE